MPCACMTNLALLRTGERRRLGSGSLRSSSTDVMPRLRPDSARKQAGADAAGVSMAHGHDCGAVCESQRGSTTPTGCSMQLKITVWKISRLGGDRECACRGPEAAAGKLAWQGKPSAQASRPLPHASSTLVRSGRSAVLMVGDCASSCTARETACGARSRIAQERSAPRDRRGRRALLTRRRASPAVSIFRSLGRRGRRPRCHAGADALRRWAAPCLRRPRSAAARQATHPAEHSCVAGLRLSREARVLSRSHARIANGPEGTRFVAMDHEAAHALHTRLRDVDQQAKRGHVRPPTACCRAGVTRGRRSLGRSALEAAGLCLRRAWASPRRTTSSARLHASVPMRAAAPPLPVPAPRTRDWIAFARLRVRPQHR